MNNTKKGFTLVELLVVIAILAILATVSVVGYTSFITNAKNSVAQQELTQIRDYCTAQEYIDEDFEVTSSITSTLELTGTLTVGYVGSDVCVKYETKDTNGQVVGAAYWYTASGTVTTTVPTGWTTTAPSTPSTGN